MEDLDQLVIASLPVVEGRGEGAYHHPSTLHQPEILASLQLGRLPRAAPQRLPGHPSSQRIPEPYLSVSVYSPWILLEASRTKKVPSGVSRSFSFTSSLKGTGLSRPVRWPQGSPDGQGTPGVSCQSPPYREMSPQYHSASCKGALFPLVRLAALGFGFGGLGSRAVRGGGLKQGELESQLPAGNPSEC